MTPEVIDSIGGWVLLFAVLHYIFIRDGE